MPCILLICGSIGSDISLLFNYMSETNSFTANLLPELTIDDFELSDDGSVKLSSKEAHIKRTNKLVTEAMDKWKRARVIYPFYFTEQLDVLLSRAYISLIEIKEPIMKRYNNYKKTHDITLEQFIELDDKVRFKTDLYKFQHFSRHIINIESEKKLLASIENDTFLNRINHSIFRPSYDEYFMSIAFIGKLRSNCMKRPVGAVVVKNERILSLGYNGTPSGLKNCYEGGCNRCNQNIGQGKELLRCFCLHAEESAILEIGSVATRGADLYTTLFPCNCCSKIIVQCVS